MQRLDQDVLLADRYRLVAPIGAGGMGGVWEAVDETLGRPVAVKVLSEALASSDRAVRRFEREARAAARLSGPHIAAVYDFGIAEDRPYIVMELVPGETLADRLARDGALPPAEAASIAVQIAQALQEAHEAGIVHRDVKPGNVMLTPAGDVKVMDFGIAAAAWAERLTTTDVLGTPAYLPPEQARGEPATPASDVYALGAVVYEMVAGRPPFLAESPMAVALAHVHEDPEPLGKVAKGVPPRLQAATMKALAKEPEARPSSAEAFAGMLRDPTLPLTPVTGSGRETARIPAVDETAPIAPVPAGAWREPLGDRLRRSRLTAPVAILAGLLLLFLLIGLVVARDRALLQEGQQLGAHRVEVPDLATQTVEEATANLERLGLTVGAIVPQPGNGAPGTVISTSPGAGSMVQQGRAITLVVWGTPSSSSPEPPKAHHDKGKHKGNEGGD